LKQRWDFQQNEMIESMDRLAIIQGQKIVQTTFRFSIKWTIESMNRLAKNQGQKNCWNNFNFFM